MRGQNAADYFLEKRVRDIAGGCHGLLIVGIAKGAR
jgi:hypothetical protein